MATSSKVKALNKEVADAVSMVNAINNEVSAQYPAARFSIVDENNFKTFSAEFRTSPSYIQNAWLDTLYNLIGLQMVMNKRVYESYFKKLHGVDIDTFDVQMIMVDLIQAKQYSPKADADDFFKDELPEVGVQYINNIVRVKFPVSTNETQLYGAFLSPEMFTRFVDGIANSMTSSLEYYDVNLVKSMIEAAAEEGNIYLIPIEKPVDTETGNSFTAKVKQTSSDLSIEPSNKYNLSHLHTFTPKDDSVLIVTTEVAANADAWNLSWMFNMELSDLRKDGMFIEIPSEGLCDGNLYGVYMDRDSLQIHELVGFPRTETFYNGSTLTLKRWLHYQAMYNMCYFTNTVGYVIPSSVGLTSATLTTKSKSTNANPGDIVYVKVDEIVVPEGKVADKFGTFSISGNTDENTTIDKNSGKLVIGPNEKGTTNEITVTWTSHLVSSVTATLDITINQ